MNELTYLGDCTLILSWSDQETAKYIELYKMYENKSATLIQTKIENEYIPRVNSKKIFIHFFYYISYKIH